MGGEAKNPLQIRARSLRRAVTAETYVGGDPSPSRVLAESMLFGVLLSPGTIIESFDMADLQTHEILSIFRDSVALNGSLSVSLVNALIESLVLAHTVTPGASLSATITNNIGLDETLTPILSVLLNDSTAYSAALSGVPITTMALTDALVLAGLATGTISAMALLTDAIALAEVMRRVSDGQIDDTITMAEAIEAHVSAFEVLIANTVFSSSLTGLAVVTGLVEERMDLGDTVSPKVSLVAMINEDIEFSVGFVFDDTPYVGIAMNAKNRAVSTYPDYAYNSLAEFNKVLYGAGDNGLFRLEGDDDNGARIDWRIRTGLTRLGDKQEKRIEAAEIGHTVTGRIVLKVTQSTMDATTRLPKLREFWYELVPGSKGAGATREGRFKPGQGLKAVYWAFELASLDPVTAGDSIDMLSLRPLSLKRRIT